MCYHNEPLPPQHRAASVSADGRAEEQRLGRELRYLATVGRQTEADDQEAVINIRGQEAEERWPQNDGLETH